MDSVDWVSIALARLLEWWASEPEHEHLGAASAASAVSASDSSSEAAAGERDCDPEASRDLEVSCTTFVEEGGGYQVSLELMILPSATRTPGLHTEQRARH